MIKPVVWRCLVLTCLAFALVSCSTAAPKSSLFQQFVVARKLGQRHTLPDYSYAGYRRSERAVPEVTAASHKAFDVTAFGAVADDGKSDRDAVLAALAAAHRHDGPAVVLFSPGTYLLSEKADLGKPPIVINRSHIVLKGSGVAKTSLVFTESPLFGKPLIQIRSSSGKSDYWRGDRMLPGKVVKQLDLFAVEVSDPSGMEPGMQVNLNARMIAQSPSTKEFFAPHEVPKGIFERHGGKLTDIFELHVIQSVVGNKVTFAEPIHLEVPYHEEIVIRALDNTVEECGIEDLSLVGNYRHQFKHHSGARFGEDYRMIALDHVFHSWVRRVRFVDYSQAIRTWLCGFNTFSDILLEGNAGHMSITSSSSYGNFFAYIREYADTHHGLGVSRSGVNSVFLRCVQYASMEAHCGYPRATLYDLNEGRFTPRGGGAKFFPMHDKGLAFWNWRVTEPGTFDFWPLGKAYGYFLRPVVVGLHGEPFEIPDQETDLAAYESPGTPVTPDSLFEAQLADRLGALPEWLHEASESFERVSRHSGLRIQEPTDHSTHPLGRPIKVDLALRPGMDQKHVVKAELLASNTSRWDGFQPVGNTDGSRLRIPFAPPQAGVWVLKAKLTNSRGEISFSDPVTIYCGKPSNAEPVAIAKASMIPGKKKAALYGDFKRKGGGEAGTLKGSKVLAAKPEDAPTHTIEQDYAKELQAFYRRYGQDEMKAIVDSPENTTEAALFFDGDLSVASGKLYDWRGTLVQAQFPAKRRINRLEIHWQNGVPGNPIRLELQTSNQLPDCWYSVVNDEPLWEPSVVRIGGTLIRQPLPGKRVSTLYFPERNVQAVRLLFTSCPNEVTELRFYGP